jgi:hypothetical protein
MLEDMWQMTWGFIGKSPDHAEAAGDATTDMLVDNDASRLTFSRALAFASFR